MASSSFPSARNISCIVIIFLTCCLSMLVHESFALNSQEKSLKRSDFPADFFFGVSTAAAQIEGSVNDGGKSPSIWDDFVHKHPDSIFDKSNLDVAIDSYKRFKEDVKALIDLGVDVYRFSIQWTRILPDGTLRGGVNQEGIDHYNSLIDELVKNNIIPFVTLMHFDYPQALQDKYGGFLNRSIVNDFKDYSELCFTTFGDRVKSWITINEPLIIAKFGHDQGFAPPVRCSNRKMCQAGDSATEPYIVSHNMLLAHATVAKLYKEKFQAQQGGEIGLSLVGQYYEPYSSSPEDKAAAKRVMDFEIGWYMEPLVYGQYPYNMRQLVKDRLPNFTEEERKLVKGSFDFIGINYYSTRYAKNIPIDLNASPIGFSQDEFANVTVDKDGVLIGPQAGGSTYIFSYPEGLQKILLFVKSQYQSPKIYITENGITEKDDSIAIAQALKDNHRIEYIRQHLYELYEAIEKGVNIKGYCYYSLFDDFEWVEGFIPRFGLYYVDYNNNLTRIPKESAKWYYDFLKRSGTC